MVMERREAVARVLAARAEALVVSGLGSASYDVYAAGDHDANFYLWGAMGGTASVGLGLALAQPNRRVMVITGDGEQLMGFGSLATIGVAGPPNLDIFVIDNERYGETGMQASHTSSHVDLSEVGAACGFSETAVLTRYEEVDALADRAGTSSRTGPALFVLKVSADNPPRALPTRDAVFNKNRFRAHLGLTTI